jgi:hypothetical protein
MVSDLFFYELALFGLLWLCLMLHHVWLSDGPAGDRKTPLPATPARKRPHDPQPFPGLTCKPHCVACEQAAQEPAGFCRNFSLRRFAGMISRCEQRYVMRESDDGDQFQRGPFP